MEQLSSHRTDFNEIWYLSNFRKSVEKVLLPLKSDKSKGYMKTYENIYDIISLNYC